VAFLRLLALLLLLAVIGVLAAPFLLTALARDRSGVEIGGTVTAKEEYVAFLADRWERRTNITVAYEPPDEHWKHQKIAHVSVARFDQIAPGDHVSVRFLRLQDLPQFPMARNLYRSGFLPKVAVDGQQTGSALGEVLSYRAPPIVWWAIGIAILLWLWKKLRVPGFTFALLALIVFGVLFAYYRTLPAPITPITSPAHETTAEVQATDHVEQVYPTRQSYPIYLDQPVDYVAVRFLPEGWRTPVVAVDEVDAKSIPGLRAGLTVPVRYDAAEPRHALIVTGTRTFPGRNIRGVIVQGLVAAVVCLVLFGIGSLIMRAFSARTRSV
jgi:hypothetical protein